MIHYVPSYFIKPTHPITVNVVGCGGTGSQILTKLAQVHHALVKGGLGMGQHFGLHVRAFDGDIVTESNIGRQGFFPADIGQNKAQVLISRLNRAYGLGWEAHNTMYNNGYVKTHGLEKANIIISCVDSVSAREAIRDLQSATNKCHAFEKQWYWLDLGNSKTVGQVILGTISQPVQPKVESETVAVLPNVFKLFPDLKRHETDEQQGPSCSVAESLSHQDLCINSMLAEWGKKMIWSIFKTMRLQHQGVFVNLDTLTVNPIPIKHDKRIQSRKNPKKNRKAIKAKSKAVRRGVDR
jgi:PRTRC genetic system ThiF family protein